MPQMPEIRRIIARAGADELGLDPAGLNETDMFMALSPEDEWRGPSTGLAGRAGAQGARLTSRASFSFAQPIDMRVQEMIIGARGDVVIKVFGDEIADAEPHGPRVAATIRKVPGASDVFTLKNEGMKYLKVKVDRFAAGRFGLNATIFRTTCALGRRPHRSAS